MKSGITTPLVIVIVVILIALAIGGFLIIYTASLLWLFLLLWSIDKGYQCHNYNDIYKVEGDRIIIERKNQQWKIGETAIPSTQVYNWKIVEGKLELTGIGSFSPIGVRYISRQTPYPQPK